MIHALVIIFITLVSIYIGYKCGVNATLKVVEEVLMNDTWDSETPSERIKLEDL